MAHKGIIENILIDTCHFKGNYPESCLLEGCSLTPKEESTLRTADIKWTTILPKEKLSADNEHDFKSVSNGVFTHVRLSIFPDGGISRMRLGGRIKQ